MYMWLRMESGAMGEVGEERRKVIIVREFHGEYEGEFGFSWFFYLMSKR
jgi:hypothetical protein